MCDKNGRALFLLVSHQSINTGPEIALGRLFWFLCLLMGAPKQKWTVEEEAALKAGVAKHGVGKWRTILKDPEFSLILQMRSNVDLKDKWRNMNVMANGWGSRDRGRLAFKSLNQVPKREENFLVLPSDQSDEEYVDVIPLAVSTGVSQKGDSERSLTRLENLVIEAITNSEEPGGSNKSSIAAYIEDQFWAPPNFKRLLSAKLKFLTSSGKLIKIKREYMIAPTASSGKRRNPPMLFLEGRQRPFPKVDMDCINNFTNSEIELDWVKIKNMNPEEADAAAARAVAEAEAAIAEAEVAAREAEAAEADAEAAQDFVEMAKKNSNGRSLPRMMIRV